MQSRVIEICLQLFIVILVTQRLLLSLIWKLAAARKERPLFLLLFFHGKFIRA